MPIHRITSGHPCKSTWDELAEERRRLERERAAEDTGTTIAQQITVGAYAFLPPAPRLIPPPTQTEKPSAATSSVDSYASQARSLSRFAQAGDMAGARRALGVMPNNRAPIYTRGGVDVSVDEDLRPLLASVEPGDDEALASALRALVGPGIEPG
ncbi:MAG: hypothetical protein M3081_18290 [Gemmatimonadota bacterium]|nr:hypothetical protein [Gemmatimonadota bacterium]